MWILSKLIVQYMDRNSFFKAGMGITAGLILQPTAAISIIDDEPEPLDISVVKEFVIAGHKDLERVREMLSDYPNLIFSRYDWGNGDFEEAIEGAGHVGNKEIANYLVDQGARINLFVLTMLGKTEIVKSTLNEYPGLLNAKGAHGFTLLHHAKVGGSDSHELFEFLTAKGLTESHVKIR